MIAPLGQGIAALGRVVDEGDRWDERRLSALGGVEAFNGGRYGIWRDEG